jgi:hypothetical protein
LGRPEKKSDLSLFIFALTLFVSAALLFLLEPMFAKMVLPVMGGTPAVWNTCMVFYQAALLAGYAYANVAARRLGSRLQTLVHLGLLLIPLAILPISLPSGWTPPTERNPILWLLLVLALSVGPPFFMLATITPTLQKWFASTVHPSANDPYFLYVASNFGSMLGLLSYPLLVEPHLRLGEQSRFWSSAYDGLVVLMGICAVALWRSSAIVTQNASPEFPTQASPPLATVQSTGAPDVTLRLRWISLAFVPASLMLGVTTVLTTEVPPIPLLWVLPLAAYLLSFILVFATKQIVPHDQMVDRLPFLILAALIPILSKTSLPVWMELVLNLMTLFVAAMVCHGELAKARPSTQHLTEFYLWMSFGGVLGGLFNALIAPLVFNTALEFPLVLIAAALMRASSKTTVESSRSQWLDFAAPVLLGASLVGLIEILRKTKLVPGPILQLTIFAPAMLLCLSFAKRRTRFALGIGALTIASMFYTGPYGHILHTERSFYGIYRVTDDTEGKYRSFFHGSTLHGMQSLSSAHSREPLSYYTRPGPIGQVFEALSGSEKLRRVAIVGLGAGSLGCYAEPGQQFTFYEIDPVVERLARDPHYFTFLRDCSPNSPVVLGDARLSLKSAPDRHYDLIVLDAFGSDAVPVHLITREALDLYLAKLREDGALVFNISNRYLDLQPVLGNLARSAGLICLAEDDTNVTEVEIRNGKFPSRWVVMARTRDNLGALAQDPRWNSPPDRPGMKVWTDDFSSILKVLKWD